MTDPRPNPDELLARVQSEEARGRRGKLKVFLGYAAGVGKTYAMLEAAHRELAAGVDVVVGYVEAHNRPETTALIEGLEAIPPRQVSYRGVALREFDLDAALARRPRLMLVDELAHTNAEGSRHAKRWQDIQELVEAGIDVYSTLNIQHLESLNDVIAQITGVIVHETIPDSVLEQVDELELVDITPEELIERLRAGKVYLTTQAEYALQNFFQRSNLQALRELALRQAAHRLSRDVQAARKDRAVQKTWATNERLLVCAGPSPTTAKLIRTAKRMAAAFGAEWLAVSVETQSGGPGAAEARHKTAQHLRLAEQLGAETHTLVGDNVAQTILDYARLRNVTKIVVGKTARPWWDRYLRGTVVDQLLEKSGDIDVYVIRGESEGAAHRSLKPPAAPPVVWTHYLVTAAVVALCGLVGWLCHTFQLAESNTVMVFLLGVAFVAARYGRGPAIAATIAGVLVFDFFFVPPYLSFAVNDAQYFLTFLVMLAIGLVISTLTARLRDQLWSSQAEERRTAALYHFTKQLSEITGVEFLVRAAGQQIGQIFEGEVALFLRTADGVVLRSGEHTSVARHPMNKIVAEWVATHDKVAGAGTDTLPSATALFMPLIGSQKTVGALGIKSADPERFLDPDQRRLLETCASLVALSIERDQSILEAHEAQLQVQAEQLRNSLLSCVSHDLRTPLAAIAGASSSLLKDGAPQDAQGRHELLQTIVEESQRLTRLVDNLLDMTRLESGSVVPNKQWHVLEEIIGSARRRVRRELENHPVRVSIPPDLPLLLMDGLLIEQVLVNLLENAARYTPAGGPIEITARRDARHVEVAVIDSGPGIPPGSEEKVFEKFFRGATPSTADGRRGVGLGLAICKGIIQAHRGQIRAQNRPGGGAEFVIVLPCDETPPQVQLDEVPQVLGA
jgi:two-component system sensor histidine kinase KdpD